MPHSRPMYAVLTGDLVNSSKLPVSLSTRAMNLLRTSVEPFNSAFPDAVVGGMDTFRHDSWQLLLGRPELAITSALYLRTVLKMQSDATTKYDTRIAIGIGEVDTTDTGKISNSRGPAFSRSGKALDSMKDELLTLTTGTDHSPLEETLARSTVPLLDAVVSGWTPTQSQAVNNALLGLTQEESSMQWTSRDGSAPTRQAISQALKRAHWKTVHAVLQWIERQLPQNSKKSNP